MNNRKRLNVARLLSGIFAAALGADLAPRHVMAQEAPATTEAEAATQYVASLKRLLETRILPDLQRGILEIAASRPPAVTLEMMNDASPYSIAAKVAPDESLIVRLSVGYMTLHDAALDAVALSAVLDDPQALNRYLLYQLRLAHENHRRSAQRARARRASTFAEFVGLDPQVAQRIAAQREWRLARDRIEVDSLGWVVAHLLVRADPKLAGSAPLPPGAGAARLAAASGWFPVPPMATAFGIAAIEGSPAAPFDERATLCAAADLMDAGISAMDASTSQRMQERGASASSRLTETRAQIARMRRNGRCAADAVTVMAAPSPSRAMQWPAATQSPSPLM